ncbi:hypothetical protein KPH14_003052 [Odynerus spinipes]|uniref:Uncharacterized protein n=1 Tax=Odynerus spinipes TaxID=1348599 RepID=A0AAD9RXA9_9HYME|nr:hypothetical protein KPH14_003052 [Odynerus spinipes]
MCMDVQANEKKEKMSDRIVDEDVQIVEARVTRGKLLHFLRLWVAATPALLLLLAATSARSGNNTRHACYCCMLRSVNDNVDDFHYVRQASIIFCFT